ncbi:uncharacterized protein LAESUDRAFT_648754 [Laetiporus sulphureus 93-53]|uniref:SMP-LTD domain-containing protein n=1 Tax=Laetiporus sulphureus 93-53 TaxID=1314785 RepID=A0A165F939_9APHY|nr:uncharacterized protein LAESUDRAFT_648754 [Laetiporus sulphureus 93-53]KZT08617.1 hypothetical protein LAESUDRAFT_648754 [Laetiporus sulphureus 93-53]
MSLKALIYAYILGGITFIPLLILGAIFYTVYTSVPVDNTAVKQPEKVEATASPEAVEGDSPSTPSAPSLVDINDLPRVRRAWLTVRRTFQEQQTEASYVGMVRGFLDSRSKDAKRSRPKDMWYVVLKGKVLYLYEDESMIECEAAIELSGHDVVIYPEGLHDGELFSKRNAISLKPKLQLPHTEMPSVTKEMKLHEENVDEKVEETGGGPKSKQREREKLVEVQKMREEAREQAFDNYTPWFIFVKSVVEMEDWYHALVHASEQPANASTLAPLEPVFEPDDMSHLVETLDEQPDVIPMRWLNALIGRLFFSFYRTQKLESYIIGRLMKKIAKVKRPTFLSNIIVREVSVGNKAPTLSKPMLKELTKEGDASLEVHLHYKGEVRITFEATATINLGARFKTYTVKLVLALVIREIDGNLLVKVKRPPSNRIWYAFTQMPKIALEIEPIVSDRQITWSMILSNIESRVKEVIQESVVLPNMDDIAFFESSRYHRRGGIWADASRRHRRRRASVSTVHHSDEEDKVETPSSAPEVPKRPLADLEHPTVQRFHSEQDATVEAKNHYGEPQEVSDLRRATTSISMPATPTSTTASRRRTWFGASREEELPPTDEADEPRGRSPETDTVPARRSSSTPTNSVIASPPEDIPQAADTPTGEDHIQTNNTRRSSSQHSQSSSSRGTSAPLSSDDEAVALGADFGSSRRPKSPTSSSFSRSTATSSTATFLQTLKSRAGDKQALSNTAKEAMRKWGVNWSGLRKDREVRGGEEIADGAHEDHQRHSTASTTRTRPSYAEVRAAVEQRKGERLPHEETALGAESRSDPVSIPRSVKGKERATEPHSSSASGGSSTASFRLASTLPVSSSPKRSTEGNGADSPQPRSLSPASHLHRVESGRSNPSGEVPAGVLPDELDEQPHSPIHTQPPQAKTMTIPGIHASHRGEVMSMGYAPPPPPPVPADAKKPTIQSVYRLWKNPSSSPGSIPRGMEAPPQTQTEMQTGFNGHDQDDAPPVTLGSLEVHSEAPPPRPVPPPLPPRSISAVPLHKPASDAASSPASAALQSIASKDRSKRASLVPGGGGLDPAGAGSEERSTTGDDTSPASQPVPSGDPQVAAIVPVASKPQPPALPPRRSTVTMLASVPATAPL